MAKLPLEGTRVIDMTVIWAGPFLSALLGDLGAEVIKIDSTQRIDRNSRGQNYTVEQLRANGGDPVPDAKSYNLSANFNSVGRNKRSVTMDLSKPEGRDVFYRLAENSDVFVENNASDVVQRLGISYEVLRERNPALIMISLPAFGTDGPYSHFRAYGANMEAVVGHTLLRLYPDTDATNATSVFLADAAGGATGAFAVMTALYHRRKTGRGQFIDLSQAENVMNTLSQAVMDFSMNGRVQGSSGNRHPYRAPQGVYRCSGEDRWLALSVGSDDEFRNLCSVIGQTALADDERFSSLAARQVNHDALDSIIETWSEGKDHYEAFHELQAVGIAASPVLNAAEVFADPHLRDRDDWQQVTHPEAGTYWHLRSPMHHMSETPLHIRKHAALLGEDNEYVYKQVCGYTDDEYQWFVDNGHAGTEVVV